MAKIETTPKIAGVSHKSVIGRRLQDPDFRFHYERRKLVHEVAVAVRAMRKSAGLTQAQLAAMVDVSQPMIAKIEKGIEQNTPRFEMLGRICIALKKQMRLSFVDATPEETHMVEVDGKPAPALEARSEA